MKHLKNVSKRIPARAIVCGEDHPGIKDSVKGLIEDPLGAILLHVGLDLNGDDNGEE